MKTISKYILMAVVAIVATACQKGLDQISSEEGMGSVKLNISTNEHTRAGEFSPEELRVRIYDKDDRLVRIYTEDDEIPENIALVAGEYTFKVEGRDKAHTTKFKGSDVVDDKSKLYYIGEETVTVTAGSSIDATVDCDPRHVRVGVVLDQTVGENKYLSEVGISLAAMSLTTGNNPTAVNDKKKADFDAAYKASTGVDRLDFGVAGSTTSYAGEDFAYFLLPENENGVHTVKTIAWSITGKHTVPAEDQPATAAEDDTTTEGGSAGSEGESNAPAEGEVTSFDKAGQIVVEPGKAYELQFRYSKLPDGSITITVAVDYKVDNWDDQITFKPEPEIKPLSGNNWLADSDDNTYVVGSSNISFEVTSINEIDGFGINDTKLWSNGAYETNAEGLITVTPDGTDGKKFTVEVKPAFFATLAGGKQEFKLSAYDGATEVGKFRTKFLNQGLEISKTEPNLWTNTATFKGVITATSATDVKVQFRKKGTLDWATANATVESGIATATSVAEWAESEKNGHTVHTPNVNKSIFANNTYECQLVVGGEAYGPIVEYTTGGGQTIPYADFESNLTCFDGGSVPSIWGSGNNSASPSLCTFGSYSGQSGSHTAKLGATEAMGILASGNIFTGQFDFQLLQGSGTVSFGVNYGWTSRPSKLKLKIHHKIGTVNSGSGKLTNGVDDDEGSIMVCIVDWSDQHKVTSGTGNPKGVWSPEDGMNPKDSDNKDVGKIIGYGIVYPRGTTPGTSMVEMEIPIYYYDKVTKPSENYTLVISAATSRYGDYKNGCKDNVMYVDDFQWVY